MSKRIINKLFYSSIAAVGAITLLAGPAMAEFAVTPPTLDYTTLGALATLVLGGGAIMWGIRKAIKVVNKS